MCICACMYKTEVNFWFLPWIYSTLFILCVWLCVYFSGVYELSSIPVTYACVTKVHAGGEHRLKLGILLQLSFPALLFETVFHNKCVVCWFTQACRAANPNIFVSKLGLQSYIVVPDFYMSTRDSNSGILVKQLVCKFFLAIQMHPIFQLYFSNFEYFVQSLNVKVWVGY